MFLLFKTYLDTELLISAQLGAHQQLRTRQGNYTFIWGSGVHENLTQSVTLIYFQPLKMYPLIFVLFANGFWNLGFLCPLILLLFELNGKKYLFQFRRSLANLFASVHLLHTTKRILTTHYSRMQTIGNETYKRKIIFGKTTKLLTHYNKT